MEKIIKTEEIESNRDRYKLELENIEKKYNGIITPEIMVKEARNPSNALHNWFDWEDTMAARKWRLHQARVLMGVIKITVNNNLSDKEYRKYLNVTITNDDGEAESVYINTNKVMQDNQLRSQIISKALKEIEYWKRIYEDYREFNLIFQDVEKVKNRLKKKKVIQ
jgi:hypothetical protein